MPFSFAPTWDADPPSLLQGDSVISASLFSPQGMRFLPNFALYIPSRELNGAGGILA